MYQDKGAETTEGLQPGIFSPYPDTPTPQAWEEAETSTGPEILSL